MEEITKQYIRERLKDIEVLYLNGKLMEDNDEKDAGGYWDLAGEIANLIADDSWQLDNLQTGIYKTIRKTFVLGISDDESEN